MNKQKKKGSCLTTCLIILAVICLFPIVLGFGWIAGAIWMIFFRKKLSSDTNKQKKYTIGVSIASILSLFIFISAMVTAPPSPTSLSLSSPMDGQTLEIDNDYTINVQYEPADASLSAVTYEINDPSLVSITADSDNPAILTLHTKGEGTISITAIKGEIESNILSFDIIDSARIEQEKMAETESLQNEEEQTVTDSDIPEETEDTTSTETEQEIENPLGFNVMFSDTYQNDVTGNWRLARISENIDIEKIALDYYNNYFKADNEIHIIINFTLNTTTRITAMGNLLDVAIMEYVDNEEHDAVLACSGMLLNEYHVNIDTGEIEEIKLDSTESLSEDLHSQAIESSSNADTPASVAQDDPILPETASSASNTNEENLTTDSPVTTTENPTSQTTGTASNDNTVSNSNRNNFDTYNNQEQQQTEDAYVLNTNRYKIHYPSCASVPKIAPQNYATSNLSIAELEAQGYTTCGNCFR